VAAPVAHKTSKSVTSELSAKLTAKQNSRLKHMSIGTKYNKHMDPPKMKSPHQTSFSHDIPVPFIDKSPAMKTAYHGYHDVESRLSVSKISINDFKSKSAAPVALNLKRNFL
jgi:hypothetical protein